MRFHNSNMERDLRQNGIRDYVGNEYNQGDYGALQQVGDCLQNNKLMSVQKGINKIITLKRG